MLHIFAIKAVESLFSHNSIGSRKKRKESCERRNVREQRQVNALPS